MASISEGTPGNAINVVSSKSTRTPGAVPIGLGSGSAFSGSVAIFIRGGVSSAVSVPFSFAYFSYFSLTIFSAFWLTVSLRFSAFAMPSNVLSSKVGPNPPVVMVKCGLRLSVSRVAVAISFMLSATTVMRLTVIPSVVACLAIHCAFVFNVLPISSSLPMQIISMFVVIVLTFHRKIA